MTVKSAPTFLHRSFQHEVLLEPCGFTKVAFASVPGSGDGGNSGSFRKTAHTRNTPRWLLFVDKRRGLLGRMVLACPSRVDPPPWRRRSYQHRTQPAPNAPGTSDVRNPRLTDEHHDMSARNDSQRTVAQFAATLLRKSQQRGRRSLPLFAEATSIRDTFETTTGPVLAADGNHQVGEHHPGDEATHPCRQGSESSSPRWGAGVEKVRSGVVDVHDAAVVREEVHPPRQDGCGEVRLREEAVKILLRGLNQPSLVAAAVDGKHQGVFFVDKTPPATALEKVVATSTAAAFEPQAHAVDRSVGGEKNNPAPASAFTNRRTAGQAWQLRYLRWGAEEPITLVRNLCNPVALCVGSVDSSVFVLEAVWERQRCESVDHRDKHRHRRGTQRRLCPRKRRYRVSRLDGACLSTWLSNEDRNNSATKSSGSPKASKKNCRVGNSRLKLNARPTAPLDASCAGSTKFATDDESETDWEVSSSGNSDREGLGEHDEHGVDGSSLGARVRKTGPGSRTRPRWRRGVVNFVEILEIPPSLRQENGGDRHPEQPVDLCVLTDGTIVVAFSRASPLHDGASIAENQGVIRAFPAADRSTGAKPSGEDTAPSTNATDETFVTTPAPLSKRYGYDADDSWLVVEGLPVVNGLAAGGGDAVYLSLCGARHDGTVTAVGCVSANLRRSPLQIDMWRGGFRYGEENRKRSEALSARDTVPTGGRNSRDVDGRNGGGDVHSKPQNFVQVVSGFAVAVAVDKDMNLFYITAESKGSCRALWCTLRGAGDRRVSSLRASSLVLPLSPEVSPSSTAAAASVGRPVQADGEGVRKIASGREFLGSRVQSTNEQGPSSTVKSRHDRRTTAKAEAAEAAAAAAEIMGKRAAALSAALIASDDEVAGAARASRKPLFHPHHDSTGGSQGGWGTAPGKDGERGGEDEDTDNEEAVNIAVVSRCRPLLAREMKRGVRAAVFCDGNHIIVSGESLPNKRERRFGFDRVFGPGTSQARVYAEAVCPVVRKMLDGFNCSVLAYGQTGSGKTFTMEGGLVDPSSPAGWHPDTGVSEDDDETTAAYEIEKIGIIPRAVHTIFREGGGGGTRRYWVYVSHMEIYNERLFDLLAPAQGVAAANGSTNPAPSQSPSHRPRPSPTHRSPRIATGGRGGSEVGGNTSNQRTRRSPRIEAPKSPTTSPSPKRGPQKPPPHAAAGAGLAIEEDRHLGVMVKGLTQVEVKNPEDIFAIIARSKSNRRTAETMCNVESSRSHGVFCVRVISAEPTPWGGEITRDGRLNLVDLSGSENIKRSGAVGARAKEAAAIGQSLLALGRVIKALVKHAPHVPYRESKLTRVLGDSLGGNAFTAIILNITPNSGMLDETLNTLTYAKTAQSVQNKPKQHVANKAPTDDATTGVEGEGQLASSSGAPSLSCNIARELKRWRGGAKSRLLSSGTSRTHVRPWENKVPICAPRPSTAAQSSPSSSGPFQQQRVSSLLPPRPLKKSPLNEAFGRNHRASGDEGDDEATLLPLSLRRPRPTTAGATAPRPSMDALSRGPSSIQRNNGRRDLARQGARPESSGDAGLSKVMTQRRRGGRGGGTAAPSSAVLSRGGPLLLPSASEVVLPSRRSRDRRDGSTMPWRVFDSTAAEWVNTVVLEHPPRTGPGAGSKARSAVAAAPSSTAMNPSQGEDASLTAAAESAIEEIFGRFDRSSSVAGRGFLRSAEVSALQEVWTRPDAEPPPPPRWLLPRCASRFPGKRPVQPQPPLQALASTAPSRNGSADGSGGALEVPEAWDHGRRDTRVLTRAGFVEFCRRAATRDAIFVRHLFARSGYDYRLDLSVPTVCKKATKAMSIEPAKGATASSSGRQRKTPVGSERLRYNSEEGAGESGGLDSDGSGDAGRGTEPPASFLAASANRMQKRGLLKYEDADVQCLTSGGIVDPAELWLWTEDERDHGERQNLDGLLSRGGGAHVSRAAATSIIGAFARTNRSGSETARVSEKRIAGDAGATSAAPPSNEAVGFPSDSSMAHDVSSTGSATPKSVGDASTRALLGDASGNAFGSGRSTAAKPTELMKCEWCGAVIVADGTASHSAAFCDEEIARVCQAVS